MNDEPLIGRCAEIGTAGVSRVDPVGESGVGGATIDAQVDRIVAALHSYRHRGIHECDIQGSVAAVLAHAGLDFVRECVLSVRDRPDFVVGGQVDGPFPARPSRPPRPFGRGTNSGRRRMTLRYRGLSDFGAAAMTARSKGGLTWGL
ncbi:hypothetical protein [Mycobacterium paragordonae]|uniref:Uncharacterized protein n=1 Tax=Mycobacterium paragordonae TaxID=1389713 RepID=A0ABQ1CG12_9MYCO|nr:hypothetical protein [Mycobacterium paragordonae]GFG83157.1 hypothetical protein MPRG_64330 [Mycobacterium paragordonae]